MNWTRWRAFWTGAALILATNAVVLGGVAYNRSGQPDGVLRLTERELRAPYYEWRLSKENSGLALHIAWRAIDREGPVAQLIMSNSYGQGNAPQWLDEAKLTALGFDVERLRRPIDRGRRDRLPSKEVFLVLELDGPAYQFLLEQVREYAAGAAETLRYGPDDKRLQQAAKVADEALKREEQTNSRLVVIDAGLNREALRAAHSDRTRYTIVRGRVGVETADGYKPRGHILSLSVDEVNVPASFRAAIGDGRPMWEQAPASSSPRYNVTVQFGKRLEPWITAASKTGP